MARPPVRLGIRGRLIFGVLTLVALSLWLLGVMLLRQSAQFLAREHEARGRAIAAAVEKAVPPLLGDAAGWPGAGPGRAALEELLSALAEDPSVAGVSLRDGAGDGVASTGPPGREDGEGAAFEYAIRPAGGAAGTVTVRFSARETSQRVAYAHLQVLVQLGVTALVLVIFLQLLLSVSVVRPIRSLVAATGRIARGDLEHPVDPGRPDELGELAAALETMRRALREGRAELLAKESALAASERMAAVGRVAAGVAHEVGNPLGAVTGYLALLRRGDASPEEARDYLARTEREIARVNRIMVDLLEWARPPRLELSDVDPGALLRDLARHLGELPEFAAVAVRVEAAPGLPTVRADYHRTRQMVLNLALNAAQAMPGGGTVTLDARAAGAGVELEVRDDGPGIPPEVAAHLFEPFVSSRRGAGGTGLGLAICRRTAEAMGAAIRVAPAAGRGTAFTVAFPARGEPAAAPAG